MKKNAQFFDKKILIIAGPTATGKTLLALKIAQKFNGDLISADSRQVYKGLDIVVGKDIPPNFHKTQDSVYTNGTTNIYGCDLVKPNQDWSVSNFHKFALKTIARIWGENKLPIIVGGTGLYLKSLYHSMPGIHTPRNPQLRNKLEKLTLTQLQQKLKTLNKNHLSKLNHSDKNNPRRLIRAIEVARYLKKNSTKQKPPHLKNANFLKTLLLPPLKTIDKNIELRIKKRFNQSWQPELKYLQSLQLNWQQPATTSLGYQELDQYQKGKIDKQTLINSWTATEKQYARRQITWFKKQPGFAIVTPTSVVDLVANWYTKTNEE